MPNFTQKSVTLLERNKKKAADFIPNYQDRENTTPEKMTPEEAEILKTGIRNFTSKKIVLSDDSLTQLVYISDILRTSHKHHVLFHGENIHKAQLLLKDFKKGAFGFWLAFTYGNRSTSYNFLNYFLLHQALPIEIRQKLEKMPLKNAYLLGATALPKEKKQSIVESYQGEKFEDWKQTVLKKNEKINPTDENNHYLKISLNALKKVKKTRALTENSNAVIEKILKLLTSLSC